MNLDSSALEPGAYAIRPEAIAKPMAARVRAAIGPDGYSQPFGLVGDVAVVSIDGVLMQRGGYWYDGYDAVVDRVRAALAEPRAARVMLKLNSPGGMAAGAFATARVLRAAAKAAGKPLLAYADEEACSGAYALACAASRIFLPASGQMGSVGVFSVVSSMSRALAAAGIDARVVRSGARKAAGHPIDPLSEEVLAAEQAFVDALAAQFFELVAEARGLTAAQVQAFEARVFLGAEAVSAGLADAVTTFEEALQLAASTPATTSPRIKTMSEKLAAAVHAMTGTTNDDEALGRLAAYKANSDRVPGLERQLADVSAKATASERDQLVAEGFRDLKITPAQRDAYAAGKGFLASLSTEQLRGYVAEAHPVGAAQGDLPKPPLGLPSASADVTLTDEEKRQARKIGVSEEDMLATKRAELALG